MGRERMRALAEALRRDPRRRDLPLYAADGAFGFFLSLAPLTAVILALLPYTPLTENELFTGVLAQMPPVVRRVLASAAWEGAVRSGTALGISLALELWSGARFFAAVRRGVEALRGGAGQGALRRRLMGAAGTAAALGLLLADLLLLRFGEGLLYAAQLAEWGPAGLWNALLRLRPAILWAGLTGVTALLYRSVRRPYLAGAALSAGGVLLYSRLYAWAMERFGLFGAAYGGIAAAAATLYWMYGALYILLGGAWLGALLEDEKGMDRK